MVRTRAVYWNRGECRVGRTDTRLAWAGSRVDGTATGVDPLGTVCVARECLTGDGRRVQHGGDTS